MSGLDIETLKERTDQHLNNPIYTINLDACHGITEKQIEEFKGWCTEQGYIFSDGRKNGWQLIWIKKP